MSKANFIVDSEFPVIDGVGHSDKISFFNVKGGGSTNTTLLDSRDFDHLYCCSRSDYPVSTDTYSSRFDPDLHQDHSGFYQLHSSDCLNGIPLGDFVWSRSSDSVRLGRIEISGSVYRPAGSWRDVTTVSEGGPFPEFPYHHPKCFVALVLDTACNGAVPVAQELWYRGGGMNLTATNHISNVPFLSGEDGRPNRFRVLGYDVLDFTAPVSQALIATATNTEEITPPILQATVEYALSQYSWPSLVKGFRFDVDLNGALCRFKGPTSATECTILNLTDLALHMYVYNFNGHDEDGFSVSNNFAYLAANYHSRLYFSDSLSPSTFCPAGADGGVVVDEAPGLDILADESAVLAGDAPEPRRKKTKASEGFFNFRPRGDPALLAFPDDFEFSRLKSGKRSKPRPSGSGRKVRRTDGEPDYYGDEFEPAPRRGKY